LTLPDAIYPAHFMSSVISNFAALNTEIGTQMTLLPLASQASGFVYEFDRNTGLFVRSAESFGPVLTERGETIGRHKFYFGGTFQRFRFSKMDGINLHDFQSVFTQTPGSAGPGLRPVESQFISTQDSVDLKVNQFTIFGTVGLTNRIDVSVAIPLLQVGDNVNSIATINRIQNTELIVTPGAAGPVVSCCSAGGPGPYGPVYANFFRPEQ
jgi:hypothetical protein